MAKYSVTFSCGHTQTVELFGKSKDRERKIEWYESNGDCTECYRAKKDADRRKQTEAAVAANQAQGLPALAGSEKQVAWAETLRREKLADVARMVAQAESGVRLARQNKPERVAAFEQGLAAACEFEAWLKDQRLAKFWIDSRFSASASYQFRDWLKSNRPELLDGRLS